MATRRLEAKNISVKLATKLTEVWRRLQAEGDEHNFLRAALGVVYDDLEVA